MALTSTIYQFDIDLADHDRGVYEHLDLRVARHPSESEDYLVTRVLAYCLEYTEGIAFSKGLSSPEDPTIAVRDLTGAIHTWVEIGAPDAARVHKAGKAAGRVAVYTHKDPGQMLRLWANERIHRLDALELYRVDRVLLDGLIAALDRRVAWSMSINDRELYVAVGDRTIEGRVARVPVG
ncbi:MAG: YaeQ family protein [Vicinamibacterales bacterium]|nr:YaeQ family protein [Vicinamibacterales bacterium]